MGRSKRPASGGSAWLWTICLLVQLSAASACDGYDGKLLQGACGNGRLDPGERCDTAIAATTPGACPAECPARDGCDAYLRTGELCARECVKAAITAPANGDGCCPPGVDNTEDDDCDVCGDGVVGSHESCDPPETCPTQEACTSSEPCAKLRFAGSPENCSARCELTFIRQCIEGDGCCPSACDADSDEDCSSVCGDGRVDTAQGETCEMSNPVARCIASCADDDPCTDDALLGSAANCNVSCSHIPIQQAADADGCCPAGARGDADSDCRALFQRSLLHRWRFTGTGPVAHDWRGTAHGTIVGASLTDRGVLELSGGSSGPYVDLPNGLLSELTSVTLEAWVTLHGSASVAFQRIFDFGNSANGEDQPATGSSFLYLAAASDDGPPRVGFATTGSSRIPVNGSAAVPRESPVHFAVVFDGVASEITLYVDGAAVGSAAVSAPLSGVENVNNWLGRSQYDQDAELNATLHEFRIYAAALSAAEVESSFNAGPDPSGR